MESCSMCNETRENHWGGIHQGAIYRGWGGGENLTRGEFTRGRQFTGGNLARWEFTGGQFTGGDLIGGNSPGGIDQGGGIFLVA